MIEETKSSLKQIINAEKDIEKSRLDDIIKNMVIIFCNKKLKIMMMKKNK